MKKGIKMVLTFLFRNCSIWLLITFVNCSPDDPITLNQLLLTTVSCSNTEPGNYPCTSTNKLIIPNNLDILPRVLSNVTVDSIYFQIRSSNEQGFSIGSMIVSFRTQEAFLFIYAIQDQEAYMAGDYIRLTLSPQENELLEKSLLTDQQILVETGMLLPPGVRDIMLTYKLQIVTLYK